MVAISRIGEVLVCKGLAKYFDDYPVRAFVLVGLPPAKRRLVAWTKL